MGQLSRVWDRVSILTKQLQQRLGGVLPALRVFRRVLTWQDRRLTLWLYISLLGTSLLLFSICALVPWTLFGAWPMRIACLALTGPHMSIVGRRAEKKAAEEETRATEYDAADKHGKALLLLRHRHELLTTARDKASAQLDARAKRSGAERERAALYADTKITLQMAPRLVSREKRSARPDESRSMATPR